MVGGGAGWHNLRPHASLGGVPHPHPAGAMTQHEARPTRGSREALANEWARPSPRPRELRWALESGLSLLLLHPSPTSFAASPPPPTQGQRGVVPTAPPPAAAGQHRASLRPCETAGAGGRLRLGASGEGDRGRTSRHSLCSASERQMQKIQK